MARSSCHDCTGQAESALSSSLTAALSSQPPCTAARRRRGVGGAESELLVRQPPPPLKGSVGPPERDSSPPPPRLAWAVSHFRKAVRPRRWCETERDAGGRNQLSAAPLPACGAPADSLQKGCGRSSPGSAPSGPVDAGWAARGEGLPCGGIGQDRGGARALRSIFSSRLRRGRTLRRARASLFAGRVVGRLRPAWLCRT